MEILLFWFAVAFVTGLAAQGRGRSGVGWFFIGLLFSVFALIAVLVMQPAGAGPAAPPARPPTPEPRPQSLRRLQAQHTVRHTVKTHRGFPIDRAGEFYMAEGRSFQTVSDAERHIDERWGREARTRTGPVTAQPSVTTAPSPPATTAYRLLGDGMFDQMVVGTDTCQSAVARFATLARGRKALVTLAAQPESAGDSRAVTVLHDGETLGFLPRDEARNFHEDTAAAGISGRAVQVWARTAGGTADKPILSLRLDLAWPLETASAE